MEVAGGGTLMDLLRTVQGQLVGILALARRWLDVVVWAEASLQ